MSPEEMREMEIDAELHEIYEGRYKRLQQCIIFLCIALIIVSASIVVHEFMKLRRVNAVAA